MKVNGMYEIVGIFERHLIEMTVKHALEVHNNEERGMLDSHSLKARSWGWSDGELSVFLDGIIKYDDGWYPYKTLAWAVPNLSTDYWWI